MRKKGDKMGTTYMNLVVNTLKVRLKWYQDSIDIVAGIKPKPNGYDFPSSTNEPFAPETMWEWRGAIKELQNTINMM